MTCSNHTWQHIRHSEPPTTEFSDSTENELFECESVCVCLTSRNWDKRSFAEYSGLVS